MVRPCDDPGGVGFIGQRAVHRIGELLVVDHRVRAFAVDHLGQRRAGERGVEQQHVCADPVGCDQRFDEAAVVAAHDRHHVRGSAGQPLQRRGQRIGALVELTVGQRSEFVDQRRTVRAALRRHRESHCDGEAFAVYDRRDTQILVGSQRGDDSRADHGAQQAERCHRRC